VSAIRYPSGCENEQVVCAFYDGEEREKIGVRTDLDTDDVPENIIITHGRIVSECLRSKRILMEKGTHSGIILCEYIAPYSSLADEIFDIIKDKNVKTVTFVEEEIRRGGFGMLLSDEMINKGYLDGIKYTVMATEDAFISRAKGQTYLTCAGLDGEHIASRISGLIN
jgi:deoxyxylulose-5-phosphate synthase